MDYFHSRGLDRLLKDIHHYPERTINVFTDKRINDATEMARSATEAAKRVIKKSNLSPLQEGLAVTAAGPLFETALEHITALVRLGIPLHEARGSVLIAINAAHAMIESAKFPDYKQPAAPVEE